MILVLSNFTSSVAPASAIVRDPFVPARHSINETGDIAVVGNALMNSSTAIAGCPAARNNSSTIEATSRNNDFAMVDVDVDADASPANSSRADFTLPANGEVSWASLYRGALTTPTITLRNEVQFQTPSTAGYQTITGSIISDLAASGYVSYDLLRPLLFP